MRKKKVLGVVNWLDEFSHTLIFMLAHGYSDRFRRGEKKHSACKVGRHGGDYEQGALENRQARSVSPRWRAHPWTARGRLGFTSRALYTRPLRRAIPQSQTKVVDRNVHLWRWYASKRVKWQPCVSTTVYSAKRKEKWNQKRNSVAPTNGWLHCRSRKALRHQLKVVMVVIVSIISLPADWKLCVLK